MAAVLSTGTRPTYFSLDEARAEIRRRWANVDLRRQIQEELGTHFWLPFLERPRALISRPILSPDNGFMFFLSAAHYLSLDPIALEFLGDNFVAVNDEKRGLGRLAVCIGRRRIQIKIVDFHLNEKRRIGDVITNAGGSLVQFHHNLLAYSGHHVECMDMTSWAHGIGKPHDFYYPYLLHFLAHGVWFNFFSVDNDERERRFTREVVMPAIQKLEQRYGLSPLVVALQPEQQDESEEFYWRCYPPHVNDYIVKYAETHSLPLRDVVW